MRVVIGGTHAGKRDAVRAWGGAPRWLEAASLLEGSPPAGDLVIDGWAPWIAAQLASEADNDRLRARLARALDALRDAERRTGASITLILTEMGRGLVPLSRRQRRLRDLNGWLAQDAAARAEAVYYVWHGLLRRLG
ncbi:bifunctional adenosylcobinamide kinase/adenosylcobinamide-phosphate guanylyltransferase [Halomonas salifodinae]|uniref:bifunctional adenosylcobinamide kinase/adenosylcobinamide-phosphate guanylyltransferase n=1 Tax=Halomonas salifodinae TaxID=438745 RepID=UPI0033BCA0D9